MMDANIPIDRERLYKKAIDLTVEEDSGIFKEIVKIETAAHSTIERAAAEKESLTNKKEELETKLSHLEKQQESLTNFLTSVNFEEIEDILKETGNNFNSEKELDKLEEQWPKIKSSLENEIKITKEKLSNVEAELAEADRRLGVMERRREENNRILEELSVYVEKAKADLGEITRDEIIRFFLQFSVDEEDAIKAGIDDLHYFTAEEVNQLAQAFLFPKDFYFIAFLDQMRDSERTPLAEVFTAATEAEAIVDDDVDEFGKTTVIPVVEMAEEISNPESDYNIFEESKDDETETKEEPDEVTPIVEEIEEPVVEPVIEDFDENIIDMTASEPETTPQEFNGGELDIDEKAGNSSGKLSEGDLINQEIISKLGNDYDADLVHTNYKYGIDNEIDIDNNVELLTDKDFILKIQLLKGIGKTAKEINANMDIVKSHTNESLLQLIEELQSGVGVSKKDIPFIALKVDKENIFNNLEILDGIEASEKVKRNGLPVISIQDPKKVERAKEYISKFGYKTVRPNGMASFKALAGEPFAIMNNCNRMVELGEPEFFDYHPEFMACDITDFVNRIVKLKEAGIDYKNIDGKQGYIAAIFDGRQFSALVGGSI